MHPIFFYLAILFLSSLLTFLVRKVALKKNVIDIPNERSSHTTPTPRGGGLAIVVCWFTGITLLFFLKMIERELYFALMSGVLLAIISLIDDVVSLKPKFRLLFQATSAIIAVYFIGGFQLHFMSIENVAFQIGIGLIAVIGVIWFINLYNFLDGIDGYASLEGIFIAIGLFVLTGNPILLLIVFSTLGFLFWNWPKAKIFMGDVGSTQLGFILIVLGIYFHNTNEVNFTLWLMLASLFWFDASLTLFRRWRNNEQISQAHKKHAYQRFVQANNSHLKTNIFALVINIVILVFVILAYRYTLIMYPLFMVILLFLYLIVRKVDYLFPFKK